MEDIVQQIDATVKQETRFVAGITLVLSILMQAIFLAIGKWDYTVLLGNLLGGGVAVGNFLVLGLTVQTALGQDEEDAKKRFRLSRSLRLLLLFVVALIAYLVPVFHILATVIPYLFPRVAIGIRAAKTKKQS